MNIAVNLDSLEIVASEGQFEDTLPNVIVRRGDVILVNLALFEDGSVVDYSSPTLELFITQAGDYETLLASSVAFSQIDTGVDARYIDTLDLSGASIDALFPDGATSKADGIVEVRVTHNGETRTSAGVPVIIQNSYQSP